MLILVKYIRKPKVQNYFNNNLILYENKKDRLRKICLL